MMSKFVEWDPAVMEMVSKRHSLSQFHKETEKRSGKSCKSCLKKILSDRIDRTNRKISSVFPEERQKGVVIRRVNAAQTIRAGVGVVSTFVKVPFLDITLSQFHPETEKRPNISCKSCLELGLPLFHNSSSEKSRHFFRFSCFGPQGFSFSIFGILDEVPEPVEWAL